MVDSKLKSNPQVHPESLKDESTHILEECRMILPGIQALFGFQLIAVFNSTFYEKLSEPEQQLHLAAIGCIAIAVIFLMAPAAYHRMAEPDQISRRFVRLASGFLAAGMLPLGLGLSADFFLVSCLITHDQALSLALALTLLFLVLMAWFVFPLCQRGRQNRKR